MKSLALVMLVWMSWVSSSIAADDLCSVAPGNCKVLKEDAKVRVLEFTAKKGDTTPMHSHPAYVVYIIKAGISRLHSLTEQASCAIQRMVRRLSMPLPPTLKSVSRTKSQFSSSLSNRLVGVLDD